MGRLLLLGCLAYLAGCGSPSGQPDAATGAGGESVIGNSRCAVLYSTLICDRDEVTIEGRTVSFQFPIGDPPVTGWPAVVFFQGSFIPGADAFTGPFAAQFGQYELTATVQAMLDGGYAVVAPNADNNGNGYWQTNIPPYATNWSGCADDLYIKAVLAAMEAGGLGAPIDMTKLHAMGISSGGFMTSRMAVSYAGTFRSLAIVAASYATCGPTCTVPALPIDHPPTLFLHGDNDTTVPASTMYPYRDQLVTNGRTVDTVIGINRGHEWLPEGKTAIPAWFETY
jgi:poly(3-hydroxybutyrate) depolymerase